jgi:hypothetical protein
MPVSISGTNGVTFPDSSLQGAAASPYVLKNRIINGAMVVDQRNAGAATANTINGYTLDRWIVAQSTTGKVIAQQNAGSVTPPVGFSNYLGITSQSAYTISSTDYYDVRQYIEGFNTADLAWGTANAKTITISFWVRSSLTGTFGGALLNSAGNRSYPFSYTISAANTWEQKTITVAGDTTGTWVGSTNGIGLQVILSLATGSTYSGTANTWAGAYYSNVTGATSVVGTSGATFYITGVQLEQNTSATPFERRLYNQELANCQRYFQKSYAQGTAVGTNTATGCATIREYGTAVFLPNFQRSLIVAMRGSPTITWYTTGGTAGSVTVGAGTNTINTQYDISDASTGWVYINGSVASNSQIYAQYTASAEL